MTTPRYQRRIHHTTPAQVPSSVEEREEPKISIFDLPPARFLAFLVAETIAALFSFGLGHRILGPAGDYWDYASITFILFYNFSLVICTFYLCNEVTE